MGSSYYCCFIYPFTFYPCIIIRFYFPFYIPNYSKLDLVLCCNCLFYRKPWHVHHSRGPDISPLQLHLLLFLHDDNKHHHYNRHPTSSMATPTLETITAYLPPSLHPFVETVKAQAPWLSVAFVSLGAVYLSYLYVLCQREAAVTFNVPLPPEVRKNWTGRKWEDLQGEEKRLLEGQVKGVSFVSGLAIVKKIRGWLTGMVYSNGARV